jgi:hypothetical protein
VALSLRNLTQQASVFESTDCNSIELGLDCVASRRALVSFFFQWKNPTRYFLSRSMNF